VYPKFEALDITPLLRVRAAPLRTTRFVADAHLGGLARQLRLFGFDTAYDNRLHDAGIVQLARDEARIVLTRDRGLLKRRGITHGCFIRALRPREQLFEVVERLDLRRSVRPFTRCLACNGDLVTVVKAQVLARLPPDVRERHERFAGCAQCGRVYWEGSHWRRMRAVVAGLAGSVPRKANEAPAAPRAIEPSS
jgi:hypothetical protein